MANSDDPFKFIEKRAYTVFYESVDGNLKKLLNVCTEDHTLVDLSISPDLKRVVESRFNPEIIPFMMYCGVTIYPTEDVEKAIERVDLVNTEKWKAFISENVQKSGLTVFMKGRLEKAGCRSSKKLVRILKKGNITTAKDINLKEYPYLAHYLKILNNFEGIPVVYSEGRFLGGLSELETFLGI